MRILLATEGPSDEVVAERVIKRYLGDVTLQKKALPARGVDVIQRLAGDFVRAGYYGHYDMLIVHFDMDDSLPQRFERADQSDKWNKIESRMRNTLKSLPEAHRSSELRIVLMTPTQATEAWLSWGRNNESGHKWELKDRHDLKHQLFGNPPRGMVEKAELFASELIAQIDTNDDWPATLKWFVDELTA